jgi:hypothetical protein
MPMGAKRPRWFLCPNPSHVFCCLSSLCPDLSLGFRCRSRLCPNLSLGFRCRSRLCPNPSLGFRCRSLLCPNPSLGFRSSRPPEPLLIVSKSPPLPASSSPCLPITLSGQSPPCSAAAGRRRVPGTRNGVSDFMARARLVEIRLRN